MADIKICENIMIDGFDFGQMEAMKYYSISKSYKGNKTEKAKYMTLSGDYIGARKMDGVFSLIIKDMDGNFYMRGRNTNVNGDYADKVDWIPHIIDELKEIPNGTALLGEIYFKDDEGSRKVTTILGCLLEKALQRQEKGKRLHFYCFDVLAYDGKSLIETPIEVRTGQYLTKISSNDYIEVAEYLEGEDLWNLFIDTIAIGGEGIVITQKDCHYLCGKRTAWKTLKLKKELEDGIDCFLSGRYKEATKLYTGKDVDNWQLWSSEKTGEKLEGKYYTDYMNGKPIVPVTKNYFYGWAGSVELAAYDKENDRIIPIGYVSGVTDEVKKGIVQNNEEWKYKCCVATCMELEHIDGNFSMRHPRLVRFRDDKNWQDCDIRDIWKD
jgi:hypothetical protein